MDHPPEPSYNGKDDGQSQGRQPIPWIWLGLGILITIVACGLAAFFLNNILLQTPSEQVEEARPTLIILTAPPRATPVATGSTLPPTSIPTFTPIPTPDTAIAPEEITIDFYATVANTDNLGVTLRGGPSTKNVALLVLDEGTVIFIIDGPEEAEDFLWWHIQMTDGTEGWVVGDYLAPAPAP